MLSCDFRRVVAVALVLTTTFITMPVTAADLSAPRPVIGSVSAVGNVDLRGLAISQEGTLFSGDSIRAHQKAYAKVLLEKGNRLELSEKTDLKLNRDAQGVQIAMNAGTLGFTARTPLRIDILPFEILASDDASGNVAIMSPTTAGVRAITGKVTVRNRKTSESFVLLKGQERLLGLNNGTPRPTFADLASNVPMPVPVPQAPAGRTSGGIAMDSGAWVAVIAGAAVAGIAITGLVIAMRNSDDLDEIKEQNSALSAQIAANNTATQAALRAISNAAALAANAAQVQATGAIAASLAAQTDAALRAAGQTALAAQAATLATSASAAATQASALQAQITTLQAQIATAGTASAAQLSSLTTLQTALTAQRNALNAAIAALNALLANPTVMNTPGVPRTSLSTVPAPATSSASIPA
jgi:hypothetical protein